VLNTENFKRLAFVVGLALVLFGVDSANAADPDDSGSFLASLKNVANPSTVPANGDQNPYGVAFSLGRRIQLGIEPARLAKALGAVTEKDLRRVADEVFAAQRHAAAFVAVE